MRGLPNTPCGRPLISPPLHQCPFPPRYYLEGLYSCRYYILLDISIYTEAKVSVSSFREFGLKLEIPESYLDRRENDAKIGSSATAVQGLWQQHSLI